MSKLMSLVFLLVSYSTFVQGNETEGLADQILMKSGSYEIIASFPEMVRAQAAQQSLFSTNQEASNKATEGLISSFNEAEANSYLLEYVVANFTVQNLKEILDWLDSPLGTRFTAAEIEAGSVEGQNNLMRYVATLSSNPPAESRILLIQEFEKKLGLTDLAMNMFKEMTFGMAKSMNAVQPESDRVSESEINADIEEIYRNMEAMMRPNVWQQMLLTSHYVYRDFSDSEISTYIYFIDSDIGQNYLGVSKGALFTVTEIFKKAFTVLAEDLHAQSPH